jgi:hypothetical protein
MSKAMKISTIILAVAAIVAASGCASNNTQTANTTVTPVSTSAETIKQNETSNVTVTDENVSADEGNLIKGINDTDVPNDYGNDTAVTYVNNTTVDIPGSGDQGILNNNTTGK